MRLPPLPCCLQYQVMMRNSLDKSQPNLVMDRTISNKAVVAQELAALWHR